MTLSATLRALRRQPWRLWMSQCATIMRLELRKNFLSRRGAPIYLLAFAPTVVIGIHAFVERHGSMQQDTLILAGIFQLFYLRLAIFFGCMGIFTRLFRGEMIARSLHYYLLAPVRRELLVVAKFFAGAITAIFFFGAAVLGSFLFMYSHFGPMAVEFMRHGAGTRHLVAYLGITVLACLGYGALFLAFSMTFKNPIVPGIIVMGWEAINPVLPAFLQKLSIIFYLRHLTPVEVRAEGLFALLTVVAEPVPAWLAVVGVMCVTALVLVYSCFRVRRLEISYTTD